MQPAQMLIADAQRAALSDLLLDLKAALLGVGILHLRSMVVKLTSTTDGNDALRMFGKNRRAGLCGGKTHADLAASC